MDTPAQTKRIVILGGGFGGLYAALYLDRTVARDPGIEVMLIDPQNFAVFTPMLHEVATGTLDPARLWCRSVRPCGAWSFSRRRPPRSTSPPEP